MRILVVGSGGREHALVWAIAASPLATDIYCAPGNAGIAADADCVDIAATDVDALVAFAIEKRIDLVVIGPEAARLAPEISPWTRTWPKSPSSVRLIARESSPTDMGGAFPVSGANRSAKGS